MGNFTIIRLAYWSLIVTTLTNCGRPPAGYRSPAVSDCSLPDQTWMKVQNGYDSKTVVALATKFEAAAKADLEKVKALQSAGGSASGQFTSDFSKVVNANSGQVVEVSQDFYEAYRSKRDALCGVLMLMKDATVSVATREAAEKQFLSMSQEWGNIKRDEQKKSGQSPN